MDRVCLTGLTVSSGVGSSPQFIHNKVYNNNVNTKKVYTKIPNIQKEFTPKKIKMTRLRQVIFVRIWLDFYEDDMSPWVLSSIRFQRGVPLKFKNNTKHLISK